MNHNDSVRENEDREAELRYKVEHEHDSPIVKQKENKTPKREKKKKKPKYPEGFSNNAYIDLCKGYSSLSYAEQLIFDLLKTDTEIVLPPKLETPKIPEFNSANASPEESPKPLKKENLGSDVIFGTTQDSKFWNPSAAPSDSIASVGTKSLASDSPSNNTTSTGTSEVVGESNQPTRPNLDHSLPPSKPMSLNTAMKRKSILIKEEKKQIQRAESILLGENEVRDLFLQQEPTVLVLRISNPKPKSQIQACFECKSPISGSAFGNARFCEYFGEYFCKQCHHNQESLVPARVTHHWDFRRYKVSEKALMELRGALNLPIVPVPKTLYSLSKRMARNKELRFVTY